MDAIGLMRRALLALLWTWPALGQADVVIEHKEVGCVVAGKFPRQLERFDYYISAVDRSFTESRTPEYAPIVVSGPGGCQHDKVLALVLEKAGRVIVSGPEGVANAPLMPVGFSTDGVVGGVAGTTSASGAASAAGGAGAGHGGAALLVVGGLAVVGGGVAIAGAAGGGAGAGGGGGRTRTTQPPGASSTVPATSTPGTTPGTTPGSQATLYHVNFTPSSDVSVCVSGRFQWCCQTVNADASGNFNETWAPNEPNTARVNGHVDAARFSATLACVSGSASTLLNASGSQGVYRGSFNFNGSSGALTVTKQQP